MEWTVGPINVKYVFRSYVIRLCDQEKHVEIEWTIGPINVGKQIEHFMFVYTTVLYEYMKSRRNDVHNLSVKPAHAVTPI
jgi:hypothetical protein